MYRKVAYSPDALFFINKIKLSLSKRAFANIKSASLSKDKAERYVQIRFFANACVDTMVDYFRGDVEMSLDELEIAMMKILDKMM